MLGTLALDHRGFEHEQPLGLPSLPPLCRAHYRRALSPSPRPITPGRLEFSSSSSSLDTCLCTPQLRKCAGLMRLVAQLYALDTLKYRLDVFTLAFLCIPSIE